MKPQEDDRTARLVSATVHAMGLVPTLRQEWLIGELCRFATGRGSREALVVDGFAGTGKTTVVGAVITALRQAGLKVVLLAPTGRAAKVASAYAGIPGKTIHRQIYRPDILNPRSGEMTLARNQATDTIFFVDEASMIASSASSGATGTHRSLLVDLLNYVYSAPGCGLVFIGDTAQLPPVGEAKSAAMDVEKLRAIGLDARLLTLEEPLRQSLESGILRNACIVRQALVAGGNPPALMVRHFEDVAVAGTEELADLLSTSWAQVGRDDTMLITRSNWRANRYNEEVRRRVLYAESPVMQGERLIVSKNNYFWLREVKGKPFLANGETVVVTWAGTPEKHYGRWYLDVELEVAGVEHPVMCKLMLRSLAAQGPCIDKEEMDKLYVLAMSQKEGELSERMVAMDHDPWYNALQVKYAYAVTCHKSQGGQWRHVYVDMAGIAPENINEDYYRWLYTSITRAREKLWLINPNLSTDADV